MCLEKQQEAARPRAEWVLGERQEGKLGVWVGLDHPGSGQASVRSCAEALGSRQRDPSSRTLGSDLHFSKALSGGCAVAKDRTHSQAYTWKPVNMERYKSVSLNPDVGSAGTGEPSEARVASGCLGSRASPQPLSASLSTGPTQVLQPLPWIQPYTA